MFKNLFILFTLAFSTTFNYYLSWWQWVLWFAYSMIFYLIILFPIFIFWSYIKKKETISFAEFIPLFFYRISILFVVIVSFFSFIIYYENEVEPANMPEFTISNWKKTVIFQWMAHIWSDKFYSQIKWNILFAKKKWYVLYFEWVRPWTKENSDKFDKLIWIEFNKKTYVDLSKMYWLRAQNNAEFLNLENNKDYNVDISIDDIVNLYQKKFGNTKPNISLNWWVPVDVTKIIDKTINMMTPNELSLFIMINRAVMNLVIKSDNLRDTIMEASWQKNIFDIILTERNKVIVDKILSSQDDKIYVLYWLMHFRWVWSMLQDADPTWHLDSIRYFKPID